MQDSTFDISLGISVVSLLVSFIAIWIQFSQWRVIIKVTLRIGFLAAYYGLGEPPFRSERAIVSVKMSHRSG
jgi:hypothetical protein